MLSRIRGEWWLVALRGLVAVVFGLIALSRPSDTAAAVVIFVALFVLIDGVLSLVAAIRTRRPSWAFPMFEGIVGVVVGILALAMPRITAVVFAVLIGIWALVTGIAELVMAFRLRSGLPSEWVLGAAGGLSVIFGVAFIVAPSAGVVALTVIVGIYALLFGIALIVYGLRLRRRPPPPPAG
ncbi:MAG: HdeD family acid-resistance protein [Spirochaetota bacterium]